MSINLITPTSARATNTEIDNLIDKNFNEDRSLGDILTLPFNFQDIKIKPNELVLKNVFNGALWKLYYNFIYINSSTKLVSNDFPLIYKGFIGSVHGATSPTPEWNPVSWNNGVSSESGTQNSTLCGAVDCIVIDNTVSREKYIMFVANSKYITVLESDKLDTTITQLFSGNKISNTSAQVYGNIKSLAINSENDLYVLDSGNNLLVKYDVNHIISKNVALTGKMFADEVIGGVTTDKYEKLRFIDPITIDITADDLVYLYDGGAVGFKIYDKELNWIRTAIKTKDFQNKIVVDIAVDRTYTGNVYVLTSDGVIYVYTALAENLIEKVVLNDSVIEGETYKKIVFSEINTNVIYILTTKSIIKKFATNLSSSIGLFRLSNAGVNIDENFQYINLLHTTDDDFDYVFAGSDQTNTLGISGKIFKFNEVSKSSSVVNDMYKYEAYTFESIQADKEEYPTPFTINKSIYKLIFNHLLFRDNFRLKYLAQYDSLGRPQHIGFNYLSVNDNNLYYHTLGYNNFVGINELTLAETTNRVLHQVYLLQLDLLDMCREKYTNRFPAPGFTVAI